MSFSKEDLWQAAEYTVQSPFVAKVKGTSEKAELSVAKSICESSATLGTKRKEHERVLDVLTAAAEDPQSCGKVLLEYVQKETGVMEDNFKVEKEKWDAEPKVDKEYIARCQQEIEKLEAEKESKIEQIRENEVSKKVAKDRKKAWKLFGIWMLLVGAGRIASNGDRSIGDIVFVVVMVAYVFTIFAFTNLVCIFLSRKKYQETADKMVKDYETELERQILELNERAKKGYDENSDFYLNLHKKELEWKIFGLELAKRQIELNGIKEIATDFQSAVNYLKNALDNFDALSNWATNFVRDQVQKEHNEEMEALERRRLYEQRKAAAAQEKAAQEQAALLKKQADAARDQAAAAQAQAEAAKRQAKDTEEIRRRMERGR